MNNIVDPARIHPGNMLRLPIMVPSNPVANPTVDNGSERRLQYAHGRGG